MNRGPHLCAWLLPCLLLCGCGGSDVDRLVADLNSEDKSHRRAAADELGSLKSTDSAVVIALESATKDRDREVRRLACFALGESRSGADALTAALDDAELSVRMAAAFALLKIEPGSSPAIAVLTNAMKLGDGGVIMAVTREGRRAEWAIPTLIELTRDERPGLRRLAVEGLGHIGVASPEVFSALQRAQKDGNDRVRESVTAAIDRINGV